jgi:hypothetical protein
VNVRNWALATLIPVVATLYPLDNEPSQQVDDDTTKQDYEQSYIAFVVRRARVTLAGETVPHHRAEHEKRDQSEPCERSEATTDSFH